MYEILPHNSCFLFHYPEQIQKIIVFWIYSFKVSPLNSDKLLFYVVVDAIITYERFSLEVSVFLNMKRILWLITNYRSFTVMPQYNSGTNAY